MKKFNASFLLLLMSFFISFTACDDDNDDPTYAAPELNVANTNIQQKPGEVVPVALNVNAEAGIQSLTVSVNGGTPENVSFVANDNNQVVTHNFTVPATAAEGDKYVLVYTLTDKQTPAKTASATVNVTVANQPSETITIKSSTNGLADVPGFETASSTLTLRARNNYILDGFVFVNSGQTLVIEPGTVIKALPGAGSDASALIVARGGKIMAEGTAEKPIIFTAISDDIDNPTDLQPTTNSLWGGVIILGKATINVPGGESAIEGIPTSETRGLYGGNDDADNSGVFKYVSIRHGGSEIGAGNEINGLTLGAVGSGTEIDYVEVFANFDDGFEFFGGAVKAKHLISAYCGDDAFDWDQGFHGGIQFALTVQNPEGSGRGFESNGVVNDATYALDGSPLSIPVVANGTFIGNYGAGNTSENEAARIRQGSGGLFFNNIWYNFAQGLRIDEITGEEPKESEARIDAGDILFKSNLFSHIKDKVTGEAATEISGVANESKLGSKNKLTALLTNADNKNAYATQPGLQAVSSNPDGGLNPLLVSGGAADQVVPYRGSEIEAVDYIGAFGSTNWALGWTALDTYGFFSAN